MPCFAHPTGVGLQRGIVNRTKWVWGAALVAGAGMVAAAAAYSTASTAADSVPGVEADGWLAAGTVPAAPPTTVALRKRAEYAPDLVVDDLGCVGDLGAETLDGYLSDQLGPMLGFDNPRVYPLDRTGGRYLWLLQDAFIDESGTATRLDTIDPGPAARNAAVVQTPAGDGACFELLYRHYVDGQGRTRTDAFEAGRNIRRERWWPLGGELDADGTRLQVFWAMMKLAGTEDGGEPDYEPERGDGIYMVPVETWLAEYDTETLEQLAFAPAPNPTGGYQGDPMWGFAVSSDDEWTYLFGNSNLLNFRNEGGLDGEHSATRTYLARVPLHRLDAVPEYWDGDGWVDDPGAAVPITERWRLANLMLPSYFDECDCWVAVAKRDDMFGGLGEGFGVPPSEIAIDVAAHPWGPWTTRTEPWHPREAGVTKNGYQPTLLPWSNPDDGLQIVISENAPHWPHAQEWPGLYRPSVHTYDWPEPPR